jgi:hypothetical protein
MTLKNTKTKPIKLSKKDILMSAIYGAGIMALFMGLMFFALAQSLASDLVHEFNNPSFSGTGYSTHVLSIEQLQHNRKQDIKDEEEADERQAERDEENKTINKFIKNIESRIYANLSKQLVDNMFKECGEDETCATTGSADIEGSTIYWSKDVDMNTITLTILSIDGTTTTMTVPIGDFGF